MSVTESRIKLTKEFIAGRLESALRDHSIKRTKGNFKHQVTFYTLHDDKFDKVINEVKNSLHEYLEQDFWTENCIEK